jgi:replicative DNA helicase
MGKPHHFTPLFQREMLVLLLQDPTAYGRFHDIWDASYFDDITHVRIFQAFTNVRAGGGQHPNKASIIESLMGGLDSRGILPMDKIAQLKELDYLYEAPPVENSKFTQSIVRKVAQQQAMVAAMGAAIEALHIDDPDKSINLLLTAHRVGTDTEQQGIINVVNDLMDAEIDETQNILGDRLLERGTFGVISGHSGAGKSILTVQAGISLARGLPILGIAPARSLKVLIVQAEDSWNDLVNQTRCLHTLVPDEEVRKEMSDRFWIIPSNQRGEKLFAELRELNAEQKVPFDLYILNPAFAYLQDGASAEDSSDVSHFLRKLLTPFLIEQDAACIIMHHPPKLNNRDTTKWTTAMWQYSMHGSAEWTNAPRFSMTIEQTASPTVFEFILGKRGSQSGWQRDSTGKFARYFKYSDPGEPMYWKEATEDDIADAQKNDDVKIADIVAVFNRNGNDMSIPQIKEALSEDGFKVDNDWLFGRMQRSPKFSQKGNFFQLARTAQQEEREEKAGQIKGMKDLAREQDRETVFSAIETAGEISVNQLSEKVGIRKETLSVHLEKLEDAGRIECRVGDRNAKLYSVK